MQLPKRLPKLNRSNGNRTLWFEMWSLYSNAMILHELLNEPILEVDKLIGVCR
jgi:hypothetical protein